MGTEVEYGISVQGQPLANPMVASSQVVNAYASATVKARRARWDFEEESPLRDARGFDMSRQVADPSQLTDEDMGLANVILTNGARLYVDHAHPEYSTPEVTTPLDIVRWDKAGEQVMLDASRRAGQLPGGAPIVLYKNNTDNKGASYGAHENYLMRRSTPFGDIVRHLTPFFVSRQVVVRRRAGRDRPGRPRARLPDQPARRLLRGRGRAGDDAQAADHQHPRRAARRPGEVPPPARHHRRRQPRRGVDVPQGRHHRAGALDDRGPVHRRGPHASTAPVPALRAVSHDPTLKQLVTLTDGRKLTAVQLQLEYLDLAKKYVEDRLGSDADPQTLDVLRPVGVGARPARARPHAVRRRARLGGQAEAAQPVPRPRRTRVGRREAAADRLPVLRHPAREGALPPAGRHGPDRAAARRPHDRGRDARPARPTPAPTSAAAAWRSTPSTSPPPRGTR